jgi:hypothetical protein
MPSEQKLKRQFGVLSRGFEVGDTQIAFKGAEALAFEAVIINQITAAVLSAVAALIHFSFSLVHGLAVDSLNFFGGLFNAEI